jgi:hypothetical protein
MIISSAVAVGVSVPFEQNMSSDVLAYPQSNESITITVQYAGPNESSPLTVFPLVYTAADKLRSNHPDLDIHVKYSATEYNKYRDQILKAVKMVLLLMLFF